MPANCVRENFALLRLLTALRGIAWTKFREEAASAGEENSSKPGLHSLIPHPRPGSGHLSSPTIRTGQRIWKMNPRTESQHFIISKDSRNQELKVKSRDVS